MNIPKIIHYCWFGGKPLPKSARKCIASWRKFLPDYEIKEWNESNFDVRMVPYTAEAYAAKKYAFVSDFARFWILHREGGVYFDTDVEVIRSMEDILERGAFMGMEALVNENSKRHYVAPGLGIACERGNSLWNEIIMRYLAYEHFEPEKQGTVCHIVSDLLENAGFRLDGSLCVRKNVTIYPADFFCPQAMMGAPIHLTENTRSIHHFDCTWLPRITRWRLRMMTLFPCWLLKSIHFVFSRKPVEK